MPENPDWTRDELILALDLYFRGGRKQLPASSPEIIELSNMLNQLPIYSQESRQTDFRNPHGVSMKLGNFLARDPDYAGEGLKRGSHLERDIWAEFSNDLPLLKATANAIRTTGNWDTETRQAHDVSRENEEFPEGKILTYLHKSKERNLKAVTTKKDSVLKQTGTLACEACGFDFARTYGELGYGFAECHHMLPLSDLTADYPTRITELSIVCANCHRMIHRRKPMLTIEELKTIIARTN